MELIKLIAYPPAPTNGGRLDVTTPRKVGDWAWQPKIDDWRGVVHVPTLRVWNQYGRRSTVAEQGKIEKALADLNATIGAYCPECQWLDIGIMENRHDMMRGCIVVFDWMVEQLNYDERRQPLARTLMTLPENVAGMLTNLNEGWKFKDTVYLVNDWRSERGSSKFGSYNIVLDPLGLQEFLLEQNRLLGRKFFEGLVAKMVSARYPFFHRPKTKTPAWIKHRFDQ